jgi:uncharacterized protein YdcH (DUF465 family)
MSHTPHELHEEFPGQIDLMHQLKMENPHFARLADQYHDVNRAIHRAETRVEAISDQAEAELRRQRLRLKDEIAQIPSAPA